MLSEYLVEGGKPGADSDKRLHKRLVALAGSLVPNSGVGVEAVPSHQERAIFDYWCSVMRKAAGTKFLGDRKQKVRSRLREGFTVEQIKRAIDGVAQSPWHRGENPGGREYTDLTMICGSPAKLEQFIEMGPPESRVRTPVIDLGSELERLSELEELKKQANEELKKGDTNAYNSTQGRIRTLRDPKRVSGDRAGSGA